MNWAAWHVSGCERWDEGSDGTEGEIDCPELGSNASFLSSASLMLAISRSRTFWEKCKHNPESQIK